MIYAVGDVHGCADELRELVHRLRVDADSTIVFLGDYIDRGPASRDVIELILELGERCHVVPLLGNHEEMFLEYLADPSSARAGAFVMNGGSATLASYADASGEIVIPERHRQFLAGLPTLYETETHLFVHAGVPQVPLAELDPERDRRQLIWMRGRFLDTDYDWGKVVVHGHTVVERATIRANRINVDTGCVYDRRLTAIALPENRLTTVRRGNRSRRVVLPDGARRRAAYRFKGEIPLRVRRGDRMHEFVTIDYSEIGMCIRPVDPSAAPALDVGDKIDGVVGVDPASRLAFVGAVVRRASNHGVPVYGVAIFDARSPDESLLAGVVEPLERASGSGG